MITKFPLQGTACLSWRRGRGPLSQVALHGHFFTVLLGSPSLLFEISSFQPFPAVSCARSSMSSHTELGLLT